MMPEALQIESDTASEPVGALYSPDRDSGTVVERRRAGEVFPRIPLGAPYGDLTREQAAVAFFLAPSSLDPFTSSEALLGVLRQAVEQHGVDGLDAGLASLCEKPLWDACALDAWAFAYRLCVAYWYEDAVCQPLGQGAETVALYGSNIEVRRGALPYEQHEVDGFLSEGIACLGTEHILRHAGDARREFGLRYKQPSAGYLAALPDRRRRRFCHNLAASRLRTPRPLLVTMRSGEQLIGCVPPINPADPLHARRGGVR